MSLRNRLVITVVGLTAVGLLVAGLLTFGALRSFLLDRVDSQLLAARQPAAIGLTHGGGPFGDRGPNDPLVPPGTYAELRNASGETVSSVTFGYAEGGREARPDLPEQLPGSGSSGGPGSESYFTVGLQTEPGRDRVLATALPRGGTLIVAIPLTEVTSTLRRLVAVMLAVSALVLAAVALLAHWRVRAGLRPLEEMGETAGAIAAGDLARRVEPAEDRTEVGRLGLALNSMLAQIESAFDERRASEDRLRRFVADASHELRTPLTSIRGYAELFRRGAADRPEDLAKAMGRIESEASRMGVMVEDLLLLARLDEGRPIEHSSLDLAEVVTDAVADARAVRPESSIQLESERPLLIEGDRLRLRQVVDNLLDNVRVHTPPGTGAWVHLSSDQQHALLMVDDDGPGLGPDGGEKLFERFYRADQARSAESGGAGLGLAIAASIVEAHGGSIEASASPQRGARFSVRIPLHSVAEPATQG